MPARNKINLSQIKNEVKNIISKIVNLTKFKKFSLRTVKKRVKDIQEDIIKIFDSHEVTREIEQGISAQNISGTLSGITNLYSFIGFEMGDDPITPIRKKLMETEISFITLDNGTLKYTISIPNAKDIFEVTPMPWAEGRSWAKGIETGISGIGYYLKKTQGSRSGLGVQSQKTKIRRNIRFKNIKYISAIIREYNDRIKKLEKSINYESNIRA